MKKQKSNSGMWLAVAIILIAFCVLIIMSNAGCSILPKNDTTFTMTGKVKSAVYQSMNGEQSITLKFEERFGKYHFIVNERVDTTTLRGKDVLVKYRIPQSHIGSVKWFLVEVKVL